MGRQNKKIDIWAFMSVSLTKWTHFCDALDFHVAAERNRATHAFYIHHWPKKLEQQFLIKITEDQRRKTYTKRI